MLNNIFTGLFDSSTVSTLSVTNFLICILCALVIGFVIAAMYMYRTKCTKSFIITLAMLPALVCVVIMMVNGNIGAGVAVAGAFSLVRFRSVPGSAKEIGYIFLAMSTGLIIGTGYIGFGILFAVILGLIGMLYTRLGFGTKKKGNLYKTLRITIPEDLDYTDVFADIFKKYTKDCELVQVKTTNMGSMFRLTYDITLNDANTQKQMIDELRCRNGNLEITVSNQESVTTEL